MLSVLLSGERRSERFMVALEERLLFTHGSCTHFSFGNAAVAIAVSDYSNEVAISLKDHTIRLFSTTDGAPKHVYSLQQHSRTCWSLVFGQGFLASGCLSGLVILWDTRTRSPIYKLQCPGPIRSLSFLGNYDQLIVTSTNKVLHWRYRRNSTSTIFSTSSQILFARSVGQRILIALKVPEKRLYTVRIMRWSFDTNTLESAYHDIHGILLYTEAGVAVNNRGDLIACCRVTNTGARLSILSLDSSTLGVEIRSCPLPEVEFATSLCFSPSSSHIIVGYGISPRRRTLLKMRRIREGIFDEISNVEFLLKTVYKVEDLSQIYECRTCNPSEGINALSICNMRPSILVQASVAAGVYIFTVHRPP
uniref:Anaphase-promoting complex subunit 4 WD40 domain-containing protein n=1 Tax=Spongospora subterranea TaxID=70186 RepID=A0A0H5QJ97_9EUKA|eukprot:CRZ01721.1 hypothetical protein [Spongospora subterranea]